MTAERGERDEYPGADGRTSRAAVAKRVEALLARMTLEEKVGQFHQGHNLGDADAADIRLGRVGSAIVASSATAGNDRQERVRAATLNRLQRVAVKESRLGIPLLFARDVIHGHRTVAPIPLGQAASWSPEHVRRCAEVAAREARADGITWVFTPMLDIARDGRWGRIAESFGEDPYLAARLAEAAVRGYQGDDLGDGEHVAACAKHFVGYGAVEGGRDYNTLEVSAYTLHNVHLPSFRAAVRAGVASVMSAFCDLNGLPVAASPDLLRRILRDDLGFGGVLVTDWEGVLELTRHGVAGDGKEAARQAFLAGNDVDMVSGLYRDHLPGLIRAGRVPPERLDEAVRRVLTLKFRLGLFERPYVDEGEAARVQFTPEHRAATLDLARRSPVLLQNRGDLLPLGAGIRVGVFGAAATWRGQLFGTWTLDGEAGDVPTLLEAVRKVHPGPHEVWHTANIDEALDWARQTDVVIVALGETPTRSGEDHSVASLDLPAGQPEMLEALHALGVRVVTVVFSGRPLVLTRVVRASEAVLLAWHPGVCGGEAVAEILYGLVNPSGHLPVSLPRQTGQLPAHYSFKPTGRPLATFPQAYRLSDERDSPLFPFGFGLSYTRFEFSNLWVDPEVPLGQPVRVTVAVKNVGERAGETVAQLYLRDVVASRTRPVRELRGFERVALEPGACRQVAFTLTADDLSFSDETGTPRLEPGEFRVLVGENSSVTLEGAFRLLAEGPQKD
ncbi:glycoside hydrolase family 3 N-terminal domain-containing protein [Deinococcus planocerae]|uniref:glycoside hydrolase family 3 N-terminal domain-containing protein n=1 Tax=Deinococcus planocerae TaxID=1737569 RepID=UPI001CA5DC84|nr:glycoside hydrolase family 3 N-terminal domain-containing protein [Deinococcus planocerae]